MKWLSFFVLFILSLIHINAQDFQLTNMQGYVVENPKFSITNDSAYLTFATNMRLYKFQANGPSSPIYNPINPDVYQWGPSQVDINVYGNNIYFFYTDYIGGNFIVKIAYSINGGIDWAHIIVDTINFGNSLPSRYDLPRIVVSQQGNPYFFYFVFQNSKDTSGIYMYNLYSGERKKLDTFFPRARYEYAITPFVNTVSNNDYIYLSYWIDSAFYLIRSVNSGQTFSSPQLIHSLNILWPSFDWQTTFQKDNLNTMYFKYDYQEFLFPYGISRNFFVTKSSDFGQTWSNPILIDTSHSYVDLRVLNNKFVKYASDNDMNLYMQVSSDLINWSEKIRINTIDSSVVTNYPAACIYNDKIAFAWIDNRTGNNEIFYRLMDIPTSVAQEFTPINFKLNQNFPNPFNSITEISFTLNQKSNTTLKVYDIFGKTIKVLINDLLEPGNYNFQFDGKYICSGIYFYELTANNSKTVKKMVMIK